jgi:hypothetical protein
VVVGDGEGDGVRAEGVEAGLRGAGADRDAAADVLPSQRRQRVAGAVCMAASPVEEDLRAQGGEWVGAAGDSVRCGFAQSICDSGFPLIVCWTQRDPCQGIPDVH